MINNKKDINGLQRWIMKFEIESFAELSDGVETLKFENKSLNHDIYLQSQKEKFQSSIPTIYGYVIFHEENIEEAIEIGQKIMARFLDVLGFTTCVRYKIIRKIAIFDWTIGIIKREGKLFTYFPNPNLPQLIIDGDIVFTTEVFLSANNVEFLQQALNRFRLGVSSEEPEIQFQWFWHVIELLALNSGNKNKIPDLCSRCRQPLYCSKCKRISEHRPYPKQAIEQVFKECLSENHERIFISASEMRNALLHGSHGVEVEKKFNTSLTELVNSIGKVAWVSLYNKLLRRLDKSLGKITLTSFQKDDFSHYDLQGYASVEIELADNENLDILQFPNFNFSISEEKSNVQKK